MTAGLRLPSNTDNQGESCALESSDDTFLLTFLSLAFGLAGRRQIRRAQPEAPSLYSSQPPRNSRRGWWRWGWWTATTTNSRGVWPERTTS